MVCVLVIFPLDPSSSLATTNFIFILSLFFQLVKRRRIEISESGRHHLLRPAFCFIRPAPIPDNKKFSAHL